MGSSLGTELACVVGTLLGMKLAELGTLDGGELELGKLLGGLEVVGRRLTDGRSD